MIGHVAAPTEAHLPPPQRFAAHARWYAPRDAGDQSFEHWVAEEGGPEAIVEMVAEMRRRVEEGLLPGFTDKEAFLEHLRRDDRRSA
jgi:hypothetical protein